MKNNYIKKTLSNGVKLYLFLDKNMKQYYVDYIVNYGSSGKWYDFYLDNKHYHVLPGCAHFLEHLLGEHSKYGNYYEKLVSKKYFSNATTAPNITHYYFRGIDDILKSIEEIINVVCCFAIRIVAALIVVAIEAHQDLNKYDNETDDRKRGSCKTNSAQ